MKLEPTPKQQRGAAVALLVLLIMLTYWLLIGSWFTAPLLDMAQQRRALLIEQQNDRTLIARETRLLQELKQRNAEQSENISLLTGSDPSLVAASLSTRLDEIIDNVGNGPAGCEITARTPITNDLKPSAPYLAIAVSLTMECRVKPLTAFMHQVESSRPWLMIEHLEISRADNAPASGGPGKLQVQMLVKGYMQRPHHKGASS